MARQEKLSKMLKDPDLDFKAFDNGKDDIPEFNWDFGADTDSNKNRSPVEHVRQGASAALSSLSDSFANNIKEQISQKMPDAARFMGDAAAFTSDIMHLGQEFRREINPSISELKRAGQALGPRIKQFLPDFLKKKYDQLVSTDDERAAAPPKINKEDTENMAIAQSIDSIFSKGINTQLKVQEEQYKDQKVDTIIDRSLGAKRHKESFEQLHQIATASTFQQRFIEQIQIPLMKKELEIKYRHFFVARDTLTELKGLSKIVEDSLAQIRHNTALPDIQKQRMMESVKEASRERLGKWATNWSKEVVNRVKERFMDPLKDMIQQVASGAEMFGSTIEAEDELGGPKGVGATVGGPLGMILGNRLSRGLAKKLFGERYGSQGVLGAKAVQLNHLFKNLPTRLGVRLKEFSEGHEGTFLGELASLFAPNLSGRDFMSATNVMRKNPNDPATLTNQAVLSITQIIPGYLAKSVQWLETIATGKKAEELIYDTDTNDWVRESRFRDQVTVKMFGSESERNRRWGERVGTIKGIAQVDFKGNSKWLRDFNHVEDDLRRWIANSIYSGNVPITSKIADLADMSFKAAQEDENSEYDGESWFDNWLNELQDTSGSGVQYFQQTFKGVKNPVALLLYLKSLLFDANGKVKRNNEATIQNLIISGIAEEKDRLAPIVKDLAARGQMRYAGDLVERGGQKFTLSNDALINESFVGVGRTNQTYRDTRKTSTKQSADMQTLLNEHGDVSLYDIINDPEFTDGMFGWVNGKVRDWIYANQETIDNIRKKGGDVTAYLKKKKEEILPNQVKQAMSKYAPRVLRHYENIEKDFTKYKDNIAKRMETIRKNSETGLRYRKDDAILDSYIARNNPDLLRQEAQDSLDSILGSTLQSGVQGPTIKFPEKLTVSYAQDKVLDVNVVNIEDLTSKLNSSLVESLKGIKIKTEAPTKQKGSDASRQAIVDAVKHFEEAFVEYAGNQSVNIDTMKAMLAALSTMSGQLDTVIGNTRSTMGKVARGIGSAASGTWKRIKKVKDHIHPIKWSMSLAQGAWNVSKGARDLAGSAASTVWGWRKPVGSWLGRKADWAKDKLKRGKDIALDLSGVAMMGIEGAVDRAQAAYADALTGFGKLRNNLRDRTTRIRNAVADRVRGARKAIRDSANRVRYIDIYLKDKVDEGNPLLSAEKQAKGVYFVDSGYRVLTSFSIDRPVKEIVQGEKGETSNIVISKDHLKEGLVDVNNKPIGGARSLVGRAVSLGMRGAKGMLGGMLGMGGRVGRFFKDLIDGKNPLANLWFQGIGMGMKGIGALGSGIAKVGRRVFGLGENVNKEVLQDVVGTRLDIIIGILKKQFGFTDADINISTAASGGAKVSVNPPSEQPASTKVKTPTGDVRPGDKDGDGERDTIFEERQAREDERKEKEETKLRHEFYKTMIKLKGSLLGGDKDKNKGFFGKLLMALAGIGMSVKKFLYGIPILGRLFRLTGGMFRLVGGIFRGIGWLGSIIRASSMFSGGLGGPGGFGKKLKDWGKKAFRFLKRNKKLAIFAAGAGAAYGLTKGKDAMNAALGDDFEDSMDDPTLNMSSEFDTDELDGADGSTYDEWSDKAKQTAQKGKDDKIQRFDAYAKEHGVFEASRMFGKDTYEAWQAWRKNKPDSADSSFKQRFEEAVARSREGEGPTVAKKANGMPVVEGVTSENPGAGSLATDLAIGYGLKKAGQFAVKQVAKKGVSMGAAALGTAAVGGPVGWVIGAGMLAFDVVDTLFFDGKYSQHIFNYIGIMQDEFVEGRCAIYGVPTSGWSISNLWGGSILRQVVKLEEETYAICMKQRPGFTDDDVRSWTKKFGLDETDENQVKFWQTWWVKRFFPCFNQYMNVLKERGFTFEDSYDIPVEQKNLILRDMESALSRLDTAVRNLEPTKDGFTKFNKKFLEPEKDVTRDSSRSKSTSTKKKESETFDEYSQRVKAEVANSEAEKAKNDLKAATGSEAPWEALAKSNPMVARMLNSGNMNTTIMNAGAVPGMDGMSGGGVVGGGNGAGGQFAGPAPDMSGINPANLKGKDGELGSYVKRFESGKGGTTTIGYDDPGGTSYGSYQLSSKMGSLKEFVRDYLQTKSPEAYRTLWPMIGQANTGSKQGPFVNAWLQLVKDGKITHEMEHEYFMSKFYGKALQLIRQSNPEIAQWIESNRALQECLWSSAVQHGPNGARTLFLDHYKPGIDVPTFLRNYYANRFTAKYFQRLAKSEPRTLQNLQKHRAKDELAVMLALAGEQPVGPDGGAAPQQASTSTGEQQGQEDPGSVPSGGTKVAANDSNMMGGGGVGPAAAGGAAAYSAAAPSQVAANTPAPADMKADTGSEASWEAQASARNNQAVAQNTAPADSGTQVASAAAPAAQAPATPAIDYTNPMNNITQLLGQLVQLQSQLPSQLASFIAQLKEQSAGYGGTFAGVRSAKQFG